MTKDHTLLAISLMVGFCVFAPLIDVAAKLASQTLPVGKINTARFLVQAAVMAPVCLWMGLGLRAKREHLGRLALRALFLGVASYCFIAAVKVMPIADALAISFVEPFILLYLGHYLFKDDIGPRRTWASVVGFAGALLVIQPSFSAFGAVALYPLGTALSFALYVLVTRSLGAVLHPVAMQYHTAAIASVIGLPLLAWASWGGMAEFAPVWPQGLAWVWLIAVGVASSFAHLFITVALKLASSSVLAPLHYLEIVAATFFGFVIFGDFPNELTWIGIGVIVSSGLYVIYRERMTSRRLRAQSDSPSLH